MTAIDFPSTRLIDAFNVTQLSPGTFLAPVLGIDLIEIASNSTSEIHRHNISDNLVYVIRGRGSVFLDGELYPIQAGCRISIPRGVAHGFKTSGDGLCFVSAQIPPILDEEKGIIDREVLVEGTDW